MNDKQLEAITKIGKFEEIAPDYVKNLGWESTDVSVHSATLATLMADDLIELKYRSSRHRQFLLTDKGRAVYESISGKRHQEQDIPPVIPEDIFDSIVGYDDVKELLRECLQLSKPIHVLLVGPPSLAKTMFLWALETAGGDRAQWAIGSASSHAALWDALAARKPRWLLLDELEKMDPNDQASLLSLMEGGRLTRLKVGREMDEKVLVWVVATANTLRKLSPELLSRFAIKRLQAYDNVTYQRVVKNVLVKMEGLGEDEAAIVAMKLTGRTQDVRDAVRVARLSKRVGVDRAVELLLGT